MLFLLRLNIGKKPAPAPTRRRVFSPPSGSTLITSAPMSASTMPQVGPITMWVNSPTRRPCSGWGAVMTTPRPTGTSDVSCPGPLAQGLGQARAPDRPVQRLALEPLGDAAAQRHQRV